MPDGHGPGEGGHMEGHHPQPTPPAPAARPYFFRLTPSTVVDDFATGKSDSAPHIMHLSLRMMYPLFYLRTYPDLSNTFGQSDVIAARQHFWDAGMREGRCATPFFDPVFYLSHYSDLRQAYGNDTVAATEHWAAIGVNEGRRGSRLFDIGYYLNSHPDLLAAFGPGNFQAAFDHWKRSGHSEGRATTSNGPKLRIVNENFAFGDADIVAGIGGRSFGDLSNIGCQIGAYLLISDKPLYPGDTTSFNAGMALLERCKQQVSAAEWAAERHEHFPRGDTFSDRDRNQYNTDQANRNANTA